MIYDCFIFYNELDLLEIRLNELNKIAGHFVLVESARTFTNQPKKLYYQENEERFSRFRKKITHLVLEEFPARLKTPWQREAFQRNAILKGLRTARPADYVLISDVDEIPRPESLKKFRGNLGILEQKLYYYYFNCQNITGLWKRSVILKRKFLTRPQAARDLAIGLEKNPTTNPHKIQTIPRGGWHFSYLGSPEAIQEKISAFSHQEFNTPQYANPQKIQEKKEKTSDLFERPDKIFRCIPLDGSFPKYLLKNKERYPQHLKELSPRDKKEAPLLKKLPRLEQRISDFCHSIKTQDRLLEEKNQRALTFSQLLRERETELEEIKNSLRWKIPNFFYRTLKRKA